VFSEHSAWLPETLVTQVHVARTTEPRIHFILKFWGGDLPVICEDVLASRNNVSDSACRKVCHATVQAQLQASDHRPLSGPHYGNFSRVMWSGERHARSIGTGTGLVCKTVILNIHFDKSSSDLMMGRCLLQCVYLRMV
jgi:hypothetical protein